MIELQTEADSFDFNGDEGSNEIHTPEDLRTELIIPGNNWGDIIVLQLLQQAWVLISLY